MAVPVPVNTLLASELAAARSILPSRLKSPAAEPSGDAPVA
ncbi:MAG TPA: hypothetical protein VJT74_08905 [Pyrinomonadaceae bacterium]|nr:hypothetical protein [Pyrinomonadaceae bacterium]